MVIKEGKAPLYELECQECGTVFRFHKADIEKVDNELGFIECPRCGCFSFTNKAKVIEANTQEDITE